MSSEQYFKCPGCGRFVAEKNLDKHYESRHKDLIATESPPAPATVVNPPVPMLAGAPIPIQPIPQKSGSIAIDIIMMKRAYPRAFWAVVGLTSLLVALAISSLFADIILFRI
jgi:hypothetical protein